MSVRDELQLAPYALRTVHDVMRAAITYARALGATDERAFEVELGGLRRRAGSPDRDLSGEALERVETALRPDCCGSQPWVSTRAGSKRPRVRLDRRVKNEKSR